MRRFQSIRFSQYSDIFYFPALSGAMIATLKFLIYVGVFFAVSAQADTYGIASLEGSIVDSSNNAILGVLVKLGTATSVTDNQGAFAFKSAALGPQVLIISGSGFASVQQPITVNAGPNKLPAIKLVLAKSDNAERTQNATAVVELSDVSVTATDSPAQTKFDDKTSADAVTESVSDNALKNTNAQNASDYLKDVSGVSVSKGANGTSNISVRGIDQRMLRITVDGQRQGGAGNPLDSIPPEIVQSLEVTKTFTPDMEADAVGGVINVNTGGTIIKKAYVQDRNQAIYNPLAPHISTRNSLSVGKPFSLSAGDNNASVVSTLSFDDQYARRERLSVLREWTAQVSPGPSPFSGESIPVMTLPLIESSTEHKQRTGFLLNADARFDDTAIYFRSNFSWESNHRLRNMNDTDPASGKVIYLTETRGEFSDVALSRRNQNQLAEREASNLSFGIKSKINGNDFDAVVAYTGTNEHEPKTLETGFLNHHTYKGSYDFSANTYAPEFEYVDETDPANSSAASGPSQYRLDYLTNTKSKVKETDSSMKLNLKINLENGIDYLKVGGKIQQRHRDANIDRVVYDGNEQALTMQGLVGESFLDLETMNYQFGPLPSAKAVLNTLSSNPTAFTKNTTQSLINSGSSDSDITESLWAIYGMGKFRFGNWTWLGGVRVEGTRDEANGNQMLLGEQGQFIGFTQQNSEKSYTEVLPGLHFRYEPMAGLLYRGSITRSMSRPNNADIAPFRTLSFIDHRSRIGAPDLKPYLSTNYDLSVDKYTESYGLFSAAVFYKKIDQFITDAQYPVTIGNLGEFIEFKRVNGEAAFAMGGELSWQSAAWTLPAKLGRGSLETNYNYNHGEAHHATRPGEVFPLPRQVDHQASLKFHDVRGPLSLDFSLSYRTGWWEDLIAEDFDNYITSAWDAQINGAYKIGKEITLSAGISNLLNRPTKHYAGSPTRMNDWQRNGPELNLGMQIKL